MNTDKKRKIKAGLSRRMIDEAEGRKCPKCGRKAAIKTQIDGDWVLKYCRFCDFEDGHLVDIENSG